MQGRTRDIRWTLVIPAVALAAVVLVFLSRNEDGTARARVIAQPARVSQTLGAREFRAPYAAPAATLAETLLAADALVKGCICPPALPECRCKKAPTLRWIVRKGVRPSDGEVKANVPARSAKLLVMERI